MYKEHWVAVCDNCGETYDVGTKHVPTGWMLVHYPIENGKEKFSVLTCGMECNTKWNQSHVSPLISSSQTPA